jgi:hypothetical protein
MDLKTKENNKTATQTDKQQEEEKNGLRLF